MNQTQYLFNPKQLAVIKQWCEAGESVEFNVIDFTTLRDHYGWGMVYDPIKVTFDNALGDDNINVTYSNNVIGGFEINEDTTYDEQYFKYQLIPLLRYLWDLANTQGK